jgi:hypothetical protein
MPEWRVPSNIRLDSQLEVCRGAWTYPEKMQPAETKTAFVTKTNPALAPLLALSDETGG